MAEEREVWSYVAHRNGEFAGAIAGSLPECDAKANKRWRKDIAKFCGDFIANGFEITRVYDRAEYEALTKPMRVLGSQKMKASEDAPQQQSLFQEGV